ncbi:RHS repeat-associated core domain-containing protein [Candidatus Amarolinea aalborgensis]|uniref:RHS repeat-associated core domain-containing protein n=1 Tax=Candidatus Amarolinea aalborgensis TaxID=2249329 RepID=UPI003BF96225
MSGGVTASYVYDGDGNRVKETIAGVTRVFIGNYYEVDNGVVKKYYDAGSVLVAENSGGALYYLLTDHLGSTALTLDSAGNRLNTNTEIRYYPYGAPRYTAGATPTTFNFTGQRRDSGSGLLYYGARWYDPVIGRFIQADTIVPQPGNPQSLNRYSYVGNQPLRFTDPSGHAAICGTSADGGCGDTDVLHTIEMQLLRGRLDPIGAKQAYYQYYRTHPGESVGAYQPIKSTEEFNGIISTGYAQAQAELGVANLGGLALGAATTNGVIFEAMSGYGGNAAHGIGVLAASGVLGSSTILKRAFRSEQDRFLRKSETGLSVHIGATDEQISTHLQGDILTVTHSEVRDLGMAVVKTDGTIPELVPYHHEIVQGPGQTWNQFKNALKGLLWRK